MPEVRCHARPECIFPNNKKVANATCDKSFFSQEDPWYKDLVQESLQLIKEKNIVLEINTRGIYKGRFDDFFPGILILQKALEIDIPLMLNTDAHTTGDLLTEKIARKILHRAGLASSEIEEVLREM